MKTSILRYAAMAMLSIFMAIPQIAFAQTASRQAPLINQSSTQFIPEGGEATFGFVIGGSAPQKLLIRVIGPGLRQLGVENSMPNPRCDIFRGNTQVYGNDDWEMQNPLPPSRDVVIARASGSEIPGVMASVGAFGPMAQDDSAVVVTLAAGAYSVRASSGNSSAGRSGVVTIEVYLVGSFQGDQAPLVNQSSIQFIPEGGDATFGFVIGGTAPRKLLIRVIGPGLSQLGVENVMPNPRCDLFRHVTRGSAQVFLNDDWAGQSPTPTGNIVLARASGSEISGVMASVGAFGPMSPNDSAMVVTLAAGNYSVRASSGNSSAGRSGRVIIEVYLVE